MVASIKEKIASAFWLTVPIVLLVIFVIGITLEDEAGRMSSYVGYKRENPRIMSRLPTGELNIDSNDQDPTDIRGQDNTEVDEQDNTGTNKQVSTGMHEHDQTEVHKQNHSKVPMQDPMEIHRQDNAGIQKQNNTEIDEQDHAEKASTPCSPPIGNVVYIKTHKTGSTTVQSIIYRYGLSRNLSFVVRRTNPYNGHVRYMKVTKDSPKKMFLPVLSEGDSCVYSGYNLSAIHVVHKKEVFETFMNPGTKYMTILRNPVTQLMSAFRFFNLGRNIKGNHSTEEKLQKYINRTTWKGSVYGRNSQMFDLGLRKDNFENDSFISSYINRLDKEFDLVLINEYFEESVVLLGRMLCWSMEDLMYTIQNNRSRPKQDIPPQLLDKMRTFNRADSLLYDHFNKTLWAKIETEGPSFWTDLGEFRRLQSKTMVRCFNSSSVNTHGMKNLTIDNFCDRYAGGLFLFKSLFKKQKRLCT